MKKKLLTGILSATLSLGLFLGISSHALAADTEGYTYTIKVHLGGNGTENASFDANALAFNVVDDGGNDFSKDYSDSDNDGIYDTLVISGLKYGQQINFYPQDAVTISSSDSDSNSTTYSVVGIRKAGSDDAVSKPTFEVTKDEDYVIAYGVGDIVAYTVNYVDANGNTLADSRTYYGPKGQALYVSYQYIAGYIPNTYNYYTENLQDGTEFTFVYNQGSYATTTTTYTDTYVGEGGGTTTIYRTVPGTTTVVAANTPAGGNGAGNGAGAGAAGAAGNGNAAADGNAADDNGVAIEDNETPLGAEDVTSIDDENTPLSGENEGTSIIPIIAIIVAVIAILSVIIAFVIIMKKKKKAAVVKAEEKKEN